LNIASSALEVRTVDLGRRSRNGQLRSHQKTRSRRDMDMQRRRRRGDGQREERGEENVERRSKRPREDDGVSGNSGGGDGGFGAGTTMLRGRAGLGPVAAPRRLQPPSTHVVDLFNFHQTTEPPTMAHHHPTTSQRPALFAPLKPASGPAPTGLALTWRFPRNPRSVSLVALAL